MFSADLKTRACTFPRVCMRERERVGGRGREREGGKAWDLLEVKCSVSLWRISAKDNVQKALKSRFKTGVFFNDFFLCPEAHASAFVSRSCHLKSLAVSLVPCLHLHRSHIPQTARRCVIKIKRTLGGVRRAAWMHGEWREGEGRGLFQNKYTFSLNK